MRARPRRPLAGLLQAQFLGTFGDNAFKIIVALLAVRSLGQSPDPEQIQARMVLASVVFTVPLVLFSLPAALLADRLSKRTTLIGLKAFEFVIMGSATLAMLLYPGQEVLALVALAGMSLQSALFSPVKAAIIPELVPHEKLSEANGLIQLVAFIAIVGGTWAGGAILQEVGAATWMSVAVVAGLSLLGLVAILQVPRTAAPAVHHRRAAARLLSRAWSALRRDRRLGMGTVGLALAWATLSLLGQNVLAYARDPTTGLGLQERWVGLPLAFCGLGAGMGCAMAGLLSRRKVELGLAPLGSVGLSLFLLAFTVWMPGSVGTVVLTAGAGFATGFILVPLEAMLQWAAPRRRRGSVLALSNAAVFTGMLLGLLADGWLASAGLGHQSIFAVGALVTLGATVASVWLLPEALWRAIVVVLTQTVYRVRIRGHECVPERGPALLVANHVSFVDGLMVMAATDRRVRFLVHAPFFDRPLIGRVLRSIRAIPVASGTGPRETLRALRSAGSALDEGDVVCIFAEGEITRMGGMLPFRRGLERIVGKRSVPLIPVYLDRLWGSLFSHADGGFLRHWPRELPYRVTVVFGRALPSDRKAVQVREAVAQLGPVAWHARARHGRRPVDRFVRQVRRAPWRAALHQDGRRSLSRLGVLAGAVLLARRLRGAFEPGERVGLLLPASQGSALLQIAAALSGRTVVPLNFTAGEAALRSAIRRAELKRVITSRDFLERTEVDLPDEIERIALEDWAGSSWWRRAAAVLVSLLAPRRLLGRWCGAGGPVSVHDPLVVLFSSGSSGEPKGVMLSHHNVDCNVAGVAQVLSPRRRDALLGVLPPFHAFGTFALWFSCCEGVPLALHPNPLDGEAVGRLVERHALTWMIATPTFLQQWSRRCEPGVFGSLRLVITGAESLPPKVADAFEHKYGVRPMEGYGATECSPVITLNAPDFRGRGFYQRGSRPGSVGHPLPGVALRIVGEDGSVRPTGEEGEILVRGPGVMLGYLGEPERTAESLVDGWYRTGDAGRLDEDGFLWLTGRLSRFSKIGGEMVPHGTVEDALQEACGAEERCVVVTGVPDPRRGEALAVLHTLDESRIPGLIEQLRASGLPNLFVPRPQHFHRVEALPLLGSGKIDLAAVRETLLERCSVSPREAGRTGPSLPTA